MNRRATVIILAICMLAVSVAQAQAGTGRLSPTASGQIAPRIGGGGTPVTSVRDGGLEGTFLQVAADVNNDWETASSSFGTPLCDATLCGTGGGTTAPHDGTYWIWFGGTGSAYTAHAEQQLFIPDNTAVGMNYSFRLGVSSSVWTMILSVDSVAVETLSNVVTPVSATYVTSYVDLTAYADGQLHTLRFDFTKDGSGGTNLSIDDIVLYKGDPLTLENADFEGPSVSPWTQTGKTSDKIKCNTVDKTYSYTGNCAFVFKGSLGENSLLKQSYSIATRSVPPPPGRAPSNYSVYAGAFVNSKNSATGKLSFKLTFDDATKLKGKVSLAGSNAYVWQQTPPKIYPSSKVITKVTASVVNTSPGGKVLIDDWEMFVTGVYS